MRTVSTAARNLLRRIEDSEDKELIYSKGGGWWVDIHCTSGKLANELIRNVLVSCAHGLGTDYEVWEVNEEGRNLLEDPNYIPKIVQHFRGRESGD